MTDHLDRQLSAIGRMLSSEVEPLTADEVIARQAFATLRPRNARRRLLVAAAATTCFAAGVGTTAAMNSLTGEEVARGLPGAAAIFEGTRPDCASLDDSLYLCRLATAPQPQPWENDGGVSKFAATPFVDDHLIVIGGCGPVTADGLRWLCATGRLAVDYGYVTADLLGSELPGVGVG